ncbi:MAG TPA: SDR family NAD(P)-dependent oxidoreductase, partial [Acidimicrobiia bacterium]|nr:SDR family NAD(P)-dependent oxidoreductase [Acidimicrobiia bacterium]
MAPLTAERLLDVILGIVGQRTGYPQEMLGAEMDLEADLSIDSIKRTEIIMELAEHLRLSRAGVPVAEGIVEQLARLKTIGAIVAWIVEHVSTTAEAAPPVAATASRSVAPVAPVAPVEPAADGGTHRYVVEPAPAPGPTAPADIAGKRFVVVDEGEGIGAATAAALRARGADALLLAPHHVLESSCAAVDGLVHVAALRPGQDPILPEAFAAIRAAVVGGAGHLLVAIGSEDPVPGLGVAGLVRTIAREYPQVSVRAVEVDTSQRPAHVAEQVAGELAASGEPFVSYRRTARRSRRVVESPLAATPDAGALLRAINEIGLGPDSVVVFTGGGRGITATCAIALARASGCRIEIIGRTPSPERPEHPDVAAALDRPSLRQALLAQGIGTPAEVEAAMRRILATREVRATLETLLPLCASVRYHCVDVCDPEAVRRVIGQIDDRWERIDGVVHGAGVLEDKMLADKTPESFARVFRTKVDGARALVAALDGRPELRFLVLFGSVSGVFGNPGQADYSAANDALDSLARLWNGRLAGRVVSIDWGPWASAGGGMVSPELEREYARRGISMIAPEDGVAALFGELAWGDHDTCQAVYMAGGAASADAFAGGDVAAPVSVQPRPRAVSALPPPSPAPRAGTAETTLRLAGTSPAELLAALDRYELDPTAPPGGPAEAAACRLAIVDPAPERLALARKVIHRGSPWRGRNDVWFTNRPLLADGRIAFLFPGFEPEPLGNVDDVAERFALPRPSISGTGEFVDQAADIVAVGRFLAGALDQLGITP